jgi:hypothetical protein
MGSRAAGCTSFHQEPEDATAAAEDDDDDDMKRLLLLANAAMDPAIMSDSSRNTKKDTESSEDVPLHQMRKTTLANAYTVLQQQDKNKPELWPKTKRTLLKVPCRGSRATARQQRWDQASLHGDKTAVSDEDPARNNSESFRIGGWMDEYRRLMDAKCRAEHLDLDDK